MWGPALSQPICPALQAARKSPSPQTRRRTPIKALLQRRRQVSAKRVPPSSDSLAALQVNSAVTQSKNQLTPAEPLSDPQLAPSAAQANLQLAPANPQLPVSNTQLALVATQANPQPAPADSQLALADPRTAQIVNPEPALANPRLLPANPQSDPLGSGPPSDAPDPIALKWAAKNPWFGTEMDMTYFAYEVHDQLIEQEGVTADMPEYYTAISARVEAEFPARFLPSGRAGVQRQGSMVLSGGQSAPTGSRYQQNSSLGMGMYPHLKHQCPQPISKQRVLAMDTLALHCTGKGQHCPCNWQMGMLRAPLGFIKAHPLWQL